MDQRAFNERITMSLLWQCAWMWEHCVKKFDSNDGEFTFGELMQGFGRNASKCKVGYLLVEPILCQCWDVFNKTKPIDGLEFDSDEMVSLMTFIKDDGYDFKFSFPIDSVFSVTRDLGCPSLLNKTRFCCRGGQRWTVLPEITKKPKAKGKPKAKATKKKQAKVSKPAPKAQPSEMSLAEQFRKAFLARLAA